MPNQALFDLNKQNVLTVGGDNDPLLDKLLFAINHATEVDIAVSFIQPSGLKLLLPTIQEALETSQSNCLPFKLRVITSDYLDITHPAALRELVALSGGNVELKIFEAGSRSFHMKSYIFVRTDDDNSFYTGAAFIGSNNISESALTKGHEWCLRYDYSKDEPQQFHHIRQEFENIFAHIQAKTLTDSWISTYIQRRKPPKLSVIDDNFSVPLEEEFVPNSAQQQALEALNDSRVNGFVKGLVVLATGMGKTFLAAFELKQFEAKKVLFVAHREEILSQALNTFALVHPEMSSGYYHAKKKDLDKDFLFASVQTLGRQTHLQKFKSDHFDYIVVDEFHHASAKTYRNILNHFTPKFLLGLTATPERTDQADILSLCDNNLVFERHLVDGIESKILVPFKYYGIWDESVDYQAIPWRNGKFDPETLENVYATKKRSRHILKNWERHQQSRTLAFCISQKHADFMAAEFNEQYQSQGYRAVSVHSKSVVKRNQALSMLDNGEIQVIFSIDLFNEGTDLPSIDTVMMLRPTSSMIIFLQQLGRGLRLHSNKRHLMVMDFIGNHHSFGNQIYSAVTGGKGGKRVTTPPKLPDGCFVNYDIEIVEFWKTLIKHRATALEEYTQLAADLNHRPTATEFYEAGFELSKVNKQHNSWFELIAECGDWHNPFEEPWLVNLNNLLKVHRDFLLHAVQSTGMTKSFKGVLLKAFLQLDGFNAPPTLEALALKSHQILSGYPDIKAIDLGEKQKHLSADDNKWLDYWNKNPVHFSCVADKKTQIAWFKVEAGYFKANFEVLPEHVDSLHECMQELVDYRLSKYLDTKRKSIAEKVERGAALKPDFSKQQSANESDIPVDDNLVELPYFPNLKIACGHFKTGTDEGMEYMSVDLHNVDPQKHFLARASGDSMNGGKNPIHDGDLLLLELVSPERAGSITGTTMAIEIQDIAGDNQYLLRVVEKQNGNYRLKANNPEYEPIMANEGMKTFARLKSILK